MADYFFLKNIRGTIDTDFYGIGRQNQIDVHTGVRAVCVVANGF